MSLLPLTLATWDYDRVRALMDGRVRIEGCDHRHINVAPEECFHRAWAGEFDAAELGFCSYLMSVARGNSPFVAIPVFTSRIFRHSGIYIRDDRGIDAPADLKGKRIGVPQYEMAAAVWIRGFLHEDFGVAPADIAWRQGGLEISGRRSPVPLTPPPGLSIEPIPDGATLSTMLAAGELDGIVTARAPSCFDAGHPHVRRLFDDYRAVEQDYFRRTKLFPIMHVVGIRRALAEQHPWLAASLLKAFGEAKRLAEAELREVNALKIGLPWVTSEVRETERLMGADYWPYGVEANLKTLQTCARYVAGQGITPREVKVEEMFAATTLKGMKI
ncbi:MAG: 4,5-dihydroxyphthalate decarboxylase [Alphaproteobacteria bacterium]|jgi:4,5-dihydroxyphthalate decarboxylase|nr:4,5-dihydroxyphthalate decarboxylase [Alphaproteobacteria bacterium]